MKSALAVASLIGAVLFFCSGTFAGRLDLGYSSYLGGGGYDQAHGVARDASGALYITGETKSFDFPTHQPYPAAKPTEDRYEYDAFVAILTPDGSGLVSSAFFGGGDSDGATGIALAEEGRFHVSTGFWTLQDLTGVYFGAPGDFPATR